MLLYHWMESMFGNPTLFFHGNNLIPWNQNTNPLGDKWQTLKLQGHRSTPINQYIKSEKKKNNII
jgi:hypothetical protein